MWISEKMARARVAKGAAETGVTTIGGESVGVFTDGEMRNVPLYAPGGYIWRPKSGQAVLVIKSGQEEDRPVVVGTPPETPETQILPGEIVIHSAGGASVVLRNDGRLELTGQILINGVELQAGGGASSGS